MTAERHRAYLSVKRFLKATANLGDVEYELLVDAAEALLLTRPGRDDDAIEALVGAELVVNQLELSRRLGPARAHEIRALLTACGPASIGESTISAGIGPASGRASEAAPRTFH